MQNNGWRDVMLEDVAAELTVGYVGPMASEYVPRGIPFLRSQNVEPLRVNQQDIKFISPEFHERIRKSALSPGDVVIVRTGKPGACTVIPDCLPVSNCSDLVIVRCGKNLDARFLAYYVNTVASHHVSSHLVGAVQQHFNVGSARKLKMLLPEIVEQRAIAAVLNALDDKIELNQRMNETLEALAQTIFKSWFVDAAATKLPKGWRAGKVSDLATLSRDSLNPGEFPNETFDHYSIPAFDDGRTPKLDTGDTIKSNKFLVSSDCVLVSKLNPRIPRVWLPALSGENRAICSTEFLVTTPKPAASREFLFCLFTNETFVSVFATMVTGTSGSHQRVKPESLLGMDVIIPPPSVIQNFTETTAPLLQRINHNIHESRTLAELRDALLPKLLSGELRVPVKAE
jgi:type I restriction enzyme S subunit